LFRKLACKLAEVTLEAHLKPAGDLTVVEGSLPANCLLKGLEISVAAAGIKGITLFWKLACKLAEVTSEAHLKAAGDLTVVEGSFPANCLL